MRIVRKWSIGVAQGCERWRVHPGHGGRTAKLSEAGEARAGLVSAATWIPFRRTLTGNSSHARYSSAWAKTSSFAFKVHLNQATDMKGLGLVGRAVIIYSSDLNSITTSQSQS